MGNKQLVTIGVANEGTIKLEVDVVKLWVPKNIRYIGDTVFFKSDKLTFSMNKEDFKRIFNK